MNIENLLVSYWLIVFICLNKSKFASYSVLKCPKPFSTEKMILLHSSMEANSTTKITNEMIFEELQILKSQILKLQAEIERLKNPFGEYYL